MKNCKNCVHLLESQKDRVAYNTILYIIKKFVLFMVYENVLKMHFDVKEQ